MIESRPLTVPGTFRRLSPLAFGLVLVLIFATAAQAATIVYKNGNANAQQWYSTSTARTIKGGSQ